MTDDLYIEKSEGAKQIIKSCYDIGKELGLELEMVYWSLDIVAPLGSARHKLRIVANTGSNEVEFTSAEIESYSTGHSTNDTNAKIRKKLESIL